MAAGVRLTQASELWEKAMRGEGKAQGTIKSRKQTLRVLVRIVGDLYVRSLTPRHIDMFFSANDHWSPGTRNKQRLNLSAFQEWAWRRRYLSRDVNLLEGRRPTGGERKKKTFLTAEQAQELVSSCEDPRDRVLVAIGLHMGLRISENCKIRWGDISEDLKYVKITRSKKRGTYEQVLAIPGRLQAELRRWRRVICKHMGTAKPRPEWYVICPKITIRDRHPDGQFFFVGHGYDPTQPISRAAYDTVKAALKRIGIEKDGEATHVLRRTALQEIKDAGDKAGLDGLRLAQLRAGHESQSTTEGYLNVDRDLDVLNDFVLHMHDGPEDEGPGAKVLSFPSRKAQ